MYDNNYVQFTFLQLQLQFTSHMNLSINELINQTFY